MPLPPHFPILRVEVICNNLQWTITNHVAFPNLEGVKNPWITFLAFFPLSQTRCPLSHAADPAWLTGGKQGQTGHREALLAQHPWHGQHLLPPRAPLCCWERGSAAQTCPSADPTCPQLLALCSGSQEVSNITWFTAAILGALCFPLLELPRHVLLFLPVMLSITPHISF